MASKPRVSTYVMIAVGILAIGAFALSKYLDYQIKNFPEVMAQDAAVTETDTPNAESASADLDLEALLKPRILGNPSAPIKISEHSSLTCPHCSDFHKNVFSDFKKAYIDTGKAYLVFSDFPLNAPALQASAIARCVPEERYFDFVNTLFDEQKDWAYSNDYASFLKTKAGEYGVSAEKFDACLNSTELRDGIVAGIKAAQSQWDINSTPSFVVNNQITISGAHDFAGFDKNIQDALSKIESASGE